MSRPTYSKSPSTSGEVKNVYDRVSFHYTSTNSSPKAPQQIGQESLHLSHTDFINENSFDCSSSEVPSYSNIPSAPPPPDVITSAKQRQISLYDNVKNTLSVYDNVSDDEPNSHNKIISNVEESSLQHL